MYYFIVFPQILCYNNQNQVFWFDHSLSPHPLATVWQEQGTQLLSYFRVQGALYRVDSSERLWFYHGDDGQWYLVLRHNSIEEALSQLEELLQLQTNSAGRAPTPLTGQPRSPALAIAQTEIQELDQTTLTLANARPSNYYEDAQANIVSSRHTLTLRQATTSAAATGPTSNFLPALSPTPSQDDIETWFAEYKKQRTSSRYQEGLANIVCPVPGCGHVSRRPHALKDHLFFTLTSSVRSPGSYF
ncbi:hypothetical protein FRC12_009216 [Ceratobasidium sp. 428]|nr:hypothetical protein FRC12_009216 [Ceratobasidium sp. 428]